MGAQVTLPEARERFAFARKKFADALGADAIRGKRLLDVGCGIGNGILAALSHGARLAVGIDINLREFGDNHFHEIGAEHGIDTSGGVMVQVDFSRTAIGFPQFDIVTCLDVMEHVAEPPRSWGTSMRISLPMESRS